MDGKSEAILDTSPFVLLGDSETFTKVLALLKQRLPRNAQLYNICLMQPQMVEETKIYVLNPNTWSDSINQDSWIVSVAVREEVGTEINISTPTNATPTEDLKQRFLNSSIINWKENHWFCALDRSISLMFIELELLNGNNFDVHPCHLFYYDPIDVLNLNVSHDSAFTMKSLNSPDGIGFIYKTWKYSSPQSLPYIKKIIERSSSNGIYLKDTNKLVAGITFSLGGFMGMLYVLDEYRGQKYGQICMGKLIVDLAKNGFIPCSSVEMNNTIAHKFHKKLGMKNENIVDFVFFKKPSF